MADRASGKNDFRVPKRVKLIELTNLIRTLHPWSSIIPAFLIAPIYLISQGVQPSWLLGTFIALFLTDSLGVQIGVHKLLSHRAFKTSLVMRRALALLAVLSGQGSPLFWVAVHMGSHHPHSDTNEDMHSPQHGIFHAFIAWYWQLDVRKLSFAPAREYLRDRFLLFLHRNHNIILITYWILLGLIGGSSALVYLGLLPAMISISLVGLVNAFMHSRGSFSRAIFLKYQSHHEHPTYNSLWLGILTMGLGLHNNHHQNPHRAFYDEKWFEIDLSRWIIPLIASSEIPQEALGEAAEKVNSAS